MIDEGISHSNFFTETYAPANEIVSKAGGPAGVRKADRIRVPLETEARVVKVARQRRGFR